MISWERRSAGLCCVGAAIWVGAAEWSLDVPFDALSLFGATFLAWVGAEIHTSIHYASNTAAPEQGGERDCTLTPHDIRISRVFREGFPTEVKRFLREHHFGEAYHESKTEPLEHLSHEWRGVDFEYDDDELQERTVATILALNRFLADLHNSSGIAARYPATTYSVPTDEERANDRFEDYTVQSIARLDAGASELIDFYEEVERLMRTRAPDEFG